MDIKLIIRKCKIQKTPTEVPLNAYTQLIKNRAYKSVYTQIQKNHLRGAKLVKSIRKKNKIDYMSVKFNFRGSDILLIRMFKKLMKFVYTTLEFPKLKADNRACAPHLRWFYHCLESA